MSERVLRISVPLDRVVLAQRRTDHRRWAAILAAVVGVTVFAALMAPGPAQYFVPVYLPTLMFGAALRTRISEGISIPVRGRGALIVRPDGLAPTPRTWIPAEAFAGLTVATWSLRERGHAGMACGVVIRLTDGRDVPVAAVRRATHRASTDRQVVLRDDGKSRFLLGSDGVPLAWSALNDAEVAERLEAEIRAVLHPASGTDAAQPLRLPRRLALTSPGRDVPEPGPDGRYLASRADTPTLTDLTTPTVYRSRATRRLRSRGYVRFNADGIVLHAAHWHEAFHLSEVADVDVAPDLDGVSRLSLVLTDGTLRDLPGLKHGLWAANAFLLGNELQWWHAAEPRGEPSGTLPWGSDDDDLVLARLRAHLAGVKATNGVAETEAAR